MEPTPPNEPVFSTPTLNNFSSSILGLNKLMEAMNHGDQIRELPNDRTRDTHFIYIYLSDSEFRYVLRRIRLSKVVSQR